MRISRKGLYALQAMLMLTSRYPEQTVTTREIASCENIPEKFLEAILLELKNARLVESLRGAKGGYRLARNPSKIFLGEIIRLMDGPLAPLGNAASLRRLAARDKKHSPLYRVFLDVRNATSNIIDRTSLADLCQQGEEK
jgi:Rrf2 family protein